MLVKVLSLALAFAPASGSGSFEDRPTCHSRRANEPSSRVLVSATTSEAELLARLVFAEGASTGVGKSASCRAREAAVFEAIAWGVMNRVRLSESSPKLRRKYGEGIRGVIFMPGQFNPAVSLRSKFSRLFLCPTELPEWERLWRLARSVAKQAIESPERNPFILTPEERKHGLSFVSHFYYPLSEQATRVPLAWVDASPGSATLVRDAQVGGAPLGTECVWFFRLEGP